MPKTIAIGEHHFILPPQPQKSEFLFVDEKDAYWRRELLIKDYRDIWFDFIPGVDGTRMYQDATLYDQDENLVSLNVEDSKYIERIYEQELKRRKYGVWFKNGDEPTYITGSHYFLLMWAKMQRPDGLDYADYREFQRDYFYLIDHCWQTPNVAGMFVSKPKKTGITNLHWSGYYLNKATMTKNKNLGAMNLDEKICAKMFRDYFMYSYNGMPNAFKPQIKSLAEMNGSIIFGQVHNNKKKRKGHDPESELNTSVFVVPARPKAMDVAVMADAWIDEAPKIRDIGDIFRTNIQAVKIQSVINGRFWMTSYTPDSDTEEFKEAREIFLNSELKTVKEGSNSQTKSGLICYHIPAYAAWEGCFNKQGICSEKEAMKRNQMERDKVKGNKRDLQAIIRQYANDKREAWGSAGAGSIFDNIRLGDLKADLEIDQHASPTPPYVEGNFVWRGKPLWEIGLRNHRKKGEFAPVDWVPLTEDELERGEKGKFRMYQDIPPDLQNSALKQGRDQWNNLIPPARFTHVMGGDPTNYAADSEVVAGSKNSGYIMNLPDDFLDTRAQEVVTKKILIEYYDRPELPDEAYEDFLKMIIYSGALASIEANAPYVATRLMEEGLGLFMLVKDVNGITTTWKRHMGLAGEKDKQYKLLRTTANADNKEMLETFVRIIKNYIDKPRGGGKDYAKTIKSERLLQQLMDLDVSNTRIYDCFMAFGYTMYGIESYLELMTNLKEEYGSADNIRAVLGALAAR